MLVYAFIPARSGSKGLPDKNIRVIAEHPLMAYSIAFAQPLDVDRVIVSSDSAYYANIARHYGALCPYLRSHEASSDTAMEEDILADMEENLPLHGISMPDIWLRVKPTNPFRNVEDTNRAIHTLKSNPEIDSVRCVNVSETRLCKINERGYLETTTPEWPESRSVIRRTELPTAYQVYNLDIFRHQNLTKFGSAYMGSTILPVVGEAITGLDINDADDFDLIKALIEAQPRPDVVSRHLVEPQTAPFHE